MRSLRPRVALLACSGLVSACASTVALDRAVMQYDATAAASISKQLLLNIARASRNEPMHFTAISSIAATYKFSLTAGIAGAQTGDRGSLVAPLINGTAEENPTVTIAPMQGEEFTQRLLTPFVEQKLTLLLRQGYDVDSLLRLMGAEIRLREQGAALAVYHNRPSDHDGYVMYRKVMAHLSSIQDLHALYVEPLHFDRMWDVPVSAVTPETFETTYKDYALTPDPVKAVYHVSKRVNGRVMISNYDPAVLPNAERVLLHAEAEEVPPNDILLDIRAGYPGGEWPMHGRLRLRSFHEILNFIGRGIGEEPEFDVTPDSRTASITENPVHALEVAHSKSSPSGESLVVDLGGEHYYLSPESGYQWNKKAFSLLYQLFQMSVSSSANVGPEITISK